MESTMAVLIIGILSALKITSAAPWISAMQSLEPEPFDSRCNPGLRFPVIYSKETEDGETERHFYHCESYGGIERRSNFHQSFFSVRLTEPGSCLVTFPIRSNRGAALETIHYDEEGKFTNSNFTHGIKSVFYCPQGWKKRLEILLQKGKGNPCKYCLLNEKKLEEES